MKSAILLVAALLQVLTAPCYNLFMDRQVRKQVRKRDTGKDCSVVSRTLELNQHFDLSCGTDELISWAKAKVAETGDFAPAGEMEEFMRLHHGA